LSGPMQLNAHDFGGWSQLKAMDPPTARILRFGVFEVDLKARELRKGGMRLKLQQKPFQILEMLLERPGELVTRKEVAERLWPGVHVTFDRSMNTAVNGLRRALGDSPRNPRFLETRSGLGYRFIAPVEKVVRASATQETDTPIDSIAVLPFANSAGDPAVDYLADGIAERIIMTLSAVDRLRIVPRSTAFRYRGRDLDAAAIGKDLNVRAILTGRVASNGSTMSVFTELMDVNTGWRLWGEQYDAPAAGFIAIEKEIARNIASKLRLRLDARQESRIATPDTHNFEAYLDYLKGRYFHSKMTEEALRMSVAYFEAALAEDPNYALAYTGLADTYGLFAFLDIMSAGEALPRAKEMALAALRIDGELAEAHASLAGVKKLYEWDWDGAEEEYLRALELNPNHAPAHHEYAALLSALGRSDQAMKEIHRAHGLDPLSLVINNEIAWHRYMARDYEGALQQAWKTLALEPRFAPAQHTLGLANEQIGNLEEAIVEFENARVCSGNHPATVAALGHAHAAAGQTGEALKLLNELEETSKRRHVSPCWPALMHTALGNRRAAFECLERGVKERDVWMVWLKVEPRFDPLRSDGRFDELLRAIRLQPADSRSFAVSL
jgi:TolB-like protein/Flp pilus assembly protein TadD